MRKHTIAFRNKTVLFDVLKSSFFFKRMMYFVMKVAVRRSRFLVVGYLPISAEVSPFFSCSFLNQILVRKWAFGMLSNNDTLYPLHGIALFSKDISRRSAVAEALGLKVPILGILDSNLPVSIADYYIPGNPFSYGARFLVIGILFKVIYQARASERIIFNSALLKFYYYWILLVKKYSSRRQFLMRFKKIRYSVRRRIRKNIIQRRKKIKLMLHKSLSKPIQKTKCQYKSKSRIFRKMYRSRVKYFFFRRLKRKIRKAKC